MSTFTGKDIPEHVRRQLSQDVRKLIIPLPILWDLLTPPEICVKPNGKAADIYWRYAAGKATAIEIPDVEFNPETGAVELPGHRFGVLVLQ